MSQGAEDQREDVAELFREYAPAIFAFCRRRLPDRTTSEDVLQDTFARYWVAVSRGSEIKNPRAFLYTVAGNLIKNYFRDRKPEVSLDSLAEDGFDPDDPDADASRLAREADLRRVIDSAVDPEDAAILALRFIEGLPLSEVGLAVGKSRIAVSVRIHRAVKKLRKHFHEH